MGINMSKVRILSKENIDNILTMSETIPAVENAYVQKCTKSGNVLPLVFYEFEPGKADMDIKSGHLKKDHIYGLKLVSWFGENEKNNIPSLIGTILIFNDRTGEPLALLNAGGITGMRTGAAGAIGAKYLARKNSQNVLIVGTGEQCPYQIAALLITFPDIKKVVITNPYMPQHAFERIEVIKRDVAYILRKSGIELSTGIAASDKLEEAVSSSDIIITATPSHTPMIQKEWVKPGTHLSCIGADLEGKEEVEPELFKISKVFVDDLAQAVQVGESEIPYKKGFVTADNMCEIGKVIAGVELGRLRDDDITIFDSTGISLQDLAVSKAVYISAEEKNIGIRVEL